MAGWVITSEADAMKTVLIVEDSASMLRGLHDNFKSQGYKVLTASDGEVGLKLALEAGADLILLDVMLPKVNGYEICQFVRQEGIETPVLLLTAKDEESDIVLGLKLGADDYVTKPFSIRELLARCEALLRRGGGGGVATYQFGDCRLDVESRTFERGGEVIILSPREFALLQYFVEHDGRALSRDAIMNAVWGYDSAVTPRSIDRFVTTLRSKVEQNPKSPQHILTVREFGYKFVSGNPSRREH